eukprot:3041822-Rhodomonas_salina.2
MTSTDAAYGIIICRGACCAMPGAEIASGAKPGLEGDQTEGREGRRVAHPHQPTPPSCGVQY